MKGKFEVNFLHYVLIYNSPVFRNLPCVNLPDEETLKLADNYSNDVMFVEMFINITKPHDVYYVFEQYIQTVFKTSLITVDKEDVRYNDFIDTSEETHRPIDLTFKYDLTPSQELNLYKLKHYELYQALCRIDQLKSINDHLQLSYLAFSHIIRKITGNKFAF